jgi:demethoxyubiquinone hydroxylase (CLK1/Coq7/Cat5 family)
MQSERTRNTVAALNDLLRGELAAVETYNQALTIVDESEARQDLRECQNSHQGRVLRLRAEILERGGDPTNTSGAWGLFANLVEKGAKVVGPGTAVSALEAGEDHGLKEYQQVLPVLDMPARSVVSADLYPQQVRTHSIVSALKHSLEARPSA